MGDEEPWWKHDTRRYYETVRRYTVRKGPFVAHATVFHRGEEATMTHGRRPSLQGPTAVARLRVRPPWEAVGVVTPG
jgi:hypothetical protein